MGISSSTKRLGFALAAVAYAALAAWNQVRVNPDFPSDVAIYFDAARTASVGGNPYYPFEIGPSFIYPPPSLLVATPFAALSGDEGRFLWAGFGIVCYLASLVLLFQLRRPEIGAREAVGLTALALLFAPFLETITVGQINTIAFLGLSGFILGLTVPRYRWLGDLGLALAVATKISPAVLIAIPVIRRDWRRTARIAAGLALLFVLSVLAFGVGTWKAFLHVLPKLLGGFPGTINQAVGPTLDLAARRGGVNIDSGMISGAFSIFVLGVFMILVWRFRNEDSAVLRLAWLAIAAMTVSSRLIWHHHLTFLLIPVVGILLSSETGIRRATAVALSLVGTGLIQVDRYVEIRFGFPPVASIAGYLLIFVACLVVMGNRDTVRSSPVSGLREVFREP